MEKIPKNSKSKAPSFQFYPSDWLNNHKLQLCRLETIGAYMNILCVMYAAEVPGKLSINGKPMLFNQVAKLGKINVRTLTRVVGELLLYGVLIKGSNDILYNERMVEDYRIRKLRTDAGKLGGNPNLLKQKGKQKTTPSSSSSSSSSISSSYKEKKEKISIKYTNHHNQQFSSLCEKRGVNNQISEAKYVEMREEFSNKIDWWFNAQACVDWNYDNGYRKISSQRLRNWMKKAMKIQQEQDVKQKQFYSDKKMQEKAQKFVKPKLEPVWTQPK